MAKKTKSNTASKNREITKTKKTTKVQAKRKTAKPLGIVTHYFPRVSAAVVELKKPLKKGDAVWIKGKTTDFHQTVDSIQIEHVPIEKAKSGEEIGLGVLSEVRDGDVIYPETKQ